MSVARPIPTSVILLGLTAVAALGFWQGFRDSYFGSSGIKNCVAGGPAVPGAVPLATPVTAYSPIQQEEPKPLEAPKKKADTPKPSDPGTATHELAPLPKPAASKPEAPPPAEKPPAKPTPPGPDEPPY